MDTLVKDFINNLIKNIGKFFKFDLIILQPILIFIFLVISINLGFELSHSYKLAYHESFELSANLYSKPCREFKNKFESKEVNKDLWELEILKEKCALFSEPRIYNNISNLDELIDTKRHTESINAASSIVLTLISIFLAGLALLSFNLYEVFKKNLRKSLDESLKNLKKIENEYLIKIESEHLIKMKKSDEVFKKKLRKGLDESLKNLKKIENEYLIKMKRSDYALIYARNEVYDIYIKQDNDASTAGSHSGGYYYYLSLLLIDDVKMHKKAHDFLISLYSTLKKEDLSKFSELLELSKEINPGIQSEYLNFDKYFP